KAGKYLTITGQALEGYLVDTRNIFRLAEFLTGLWWTAGCGRFDGGISIHVDIDIEKIDYKKPESEALYNGLGQKVGDSSTWVPEMVPFEKMWNFAIDTAVGGMVGYPGYEHPRSDEGFRHCVAQHAQNYMIGTKKQLGRYKKYADQYFDAVLRSVDKIKADKEAMFKDPYILHAIQYAAADAKKISENIQYFTFDYGVKT
ncbi:hypothetical protein COT47_05200, partial [Candidatus Woesearchaeota archaeon CG08_land_8_20_14_0_20_43_7]